MVPGYCYHRTIAQQFKNNFMGRYFKALLALYIVLRALSFFLRNHLLTQELIAAALVGLFLYYCIKNLSLAWKLLVIELILDGAGHFFELRGLLLRTWFLGIFALVWVWHRARTKSPLVLPPKNTLIALGIFGLFFVWSVIGGLMRGHSITYVLQDAILYLFILVIFPALEMETDWRASKVFIWGSTIFSVATLALYSSHLFVLKDPYYHWFRNVAAGKITDLGLNFFRIVLPEQILFVPIILILMSFLLKKNTDKKLWALMCCSLLVLALNFTRIYFLALITGVLCLFVRASWKNWIKVSGITAIAFTLLFFSVHFVASRGQSVGLELLGVRVSGISAPESDPSGVIRLALLPDILHTIKKNPLLGSGLGTTATYIDPLTKATMTRTQFDWGYLEMVAELGIIGTIAYLFLLATIIYNFARGSDSPLARGLVAGAIALFVVNITTPALFQGFGVLYFAFLAAFKDQTRET